MFHGKFKKLNEYGRKQYIKLKLRNVKCQDCSHCTIDSSNNQYSYFCDAFIKESHVEVLKDDWCVFWEQRKVSPKLEEQFKKAKQDIDQYLRGR